MFDQSRSKSFNIFLTSSLAKQIFRSLLIMISDSEQSKFIKGAKKLNIYFFIIFYFI